jgi:uncharacterized protein (DUF1501 family)
VQLRRPRARLSRRDFLRGTGAGIVALAVPPLWSKQSQAAGADPVVVSIFLRGGADALSLVVPHGDPDYAARRPTIKLAAGSTRDLDGFYGLHPSLAPLESLYRDGSLVIVHAVGSPDPTRSHFEAQDFIETAAPGARNVGAGWLNRYLATQSITGSFAGISIGSSKVRSLVGGVDTVSMVSLDTFQPGGLLQSDRLAAIQEAFEAWHDARLRDTSDEMLEGAAIVATVDRTTSVVYPDTDFAIALRDAAALVKAQIGVRALAIDLPGFDHHTDANRDMPTVAAALAAGLAAFQQDLGTHAARTLTLVMSEFGRTAAENGGGGTDHGHGGVLFALGGGVRGGRVLTRGGNWPGLATADLWDGRDLAVTTDFRDVFAEVLRRHLGVANPSAILNDYSTNPSRELGLWS